MIRSSVDLPAPLRPSTPILAPGKKLREMSLRTFLSGGWTRESLYIVKMYWVDTPPQDRRAPARGSGCGARPAPHRSAWI